MTSPFNHPIASPRLAGRQASNRVGNYGLSAEVEGASGRVAGEMVSGWQVSVAVNKLSHGVDKNELGGDSGAVITTAGQLRRGTPVDPAVLQ